MWNFFFWHAVLCYVAIWCDPWKHLDLDRGESVGVKVCQSSFQLERYRDWEVPDDEHEVIHELPVQISAPGATGKCMQCTFLLEIHQFKFLLSNTNVLQASRVLPLKCFCHGKRQLLLFRFMTATMNPYWSEKMSKTSPEMLPTNLWIHWFGVSLSSPHSSKVLAQSHVHI